MPTQIPKPPRRPPEGFPGKTPVITDERILHMQDISQGHRVLDRNGSWQPVTNVHRRKGSTVRVSGHGHAGIEASDGHPVLVRSTSNGGTPGWMSAGLFDRKSHAWATPTHIDPLPIPAGAPDTPAEWHLVGSYLRSGQVDGDRITIKAADKREAQHIREHVAGGLGAGREHQGGVIFEGRDREQARFLAEHFGDKPHTKTVPPWGLGMDERYRRALLKGYYGPDWKPLPTTSPFLVTGMRLIAETLGERTDIEHVFAPFRPTYKARRMDAGHGHSGHHSWHGEQQAKKMLGQQELHDIETGGGEGGSMCVGVGGMMVSAYGEKPPPKPNARSRAAATPPPTAARNGGGGGGSNGRGAQSPASKPRRMPSVASIADALGSSVPMIGGRKPRPPQRDTAGVVPLTPAQEQRVQRGIRSLDGVQREDAVADTTAVPQSARAREAARVAEDRLNQRGVSVAELASMREADAAAGAVPGTEASRIAKERGLVLHDVADVQRIEQSPANLPADTRWRDIQTLPEFGEQTARWLEGSVPTHPGYQGGGPDEETSELVPHLAALNRAGFVTYGSQPGVAPSAGFDGATWAQRAYVEGFAVDSKTADEIERQARNAGLDVHRQSGAGWRRHYEDAPPLITRNGEGATGIGYPSRSDVRSISGGHLHGQLRDAEQLVIVDPEFGPSNRLTSFAEGFAATKRPSTPDLRDELRTPAERQEREARMVAAEQAHAQDRAHTATAERPAITDAPPTSTVRDAVGRDGYDVFAAERRGIAATPEHAAQPVVTRVDGRPVTAEIVDMAGAVGNGHAGLPSAERPRLDAGSQEPDLLQQITDASALREMQAVSVGRNEAGHAYTATGLAANADTPRMPIDLEAARAGRAHRDDMGWLSPPDATPHPEPTAVPPGWSEAYATQARVAAKARERGIPVDREAFERNLDEAWARLGGQGPRTTPPERERGLRRAGEGDLPEPVYGQGRTVEQNDVAPEHRRGRLRPEDAELPPPPTVENAQPTERPSHDPDVLERHGLRDLAQDHEPSPKPADNAGDERPTNGPSRPDADEEQDREQAKEARPEPEASREGADAKPERDAEPERETELVADHTPEPEPARETAETRDLAPDHSAAETDTTPSHEIGGNSHGMG
jgi:hypothetical protein